jgi:hypothetical protein
MTGTGGVSRFCLEPLNGWIARMAVVLGRLAVARMQTFVQVRWWLLRCLLRVVLRRSGLWTGHGESRHSLSAEGWPGAE